jgi:hypothetical protein
MWRTDNDSVSHCGVQLDDVFHLFGEYLLAARHDAVRIAAEECHHPVRVQPTNIASQNPASPRQRYEGLRGPVRVTPIAGRQGSGACDDAHFAHLGEPTTGQILVEAAAATSPLETMIAREAYAQGSPSIFVQME